LFRKTRWWKAPFIRSAPKGDGNVSLFLFYRYLYRKDNMAKDIILTEKQLEKLVNGLKKNVNEDKEGGSYMAKQQLYTIALLAHKMWEAMEDGEQLEDWMESKIAQCESSITSVVKSYMYDEFVDDNRGMGSLNFDEIVIGK
jgi:hypothetical protein